MTVRTVTFTTVIALALVRTTTGAQQPPAIRLLGKIERVSTDSLASVAAALPMPGGHVLVNDITARRVLLFDSTLTKATLVADSTSATANAYGTSAGTLIRYREDSALFIDQSSLSMLVLGPTGAIVRVMAIPRPDEARFLIGDAFGTPGIDPRGRLAYFSGEVGGIMMLSVDSRVELTSGTPPPSAFDRNIDSAFVVRVDLATRTLDTAASFKIAKARRTFTIDRQGFIKSIRTTPDPLPVIDGWTLFPDGSIAVVRGRDYHVDWLDGDGRWTSSPKMPFDWQHVDDEHKRALIDSAVTAMQAMMDRMVSGRSGAGRRGDGGGRGAGGGRGGGGGSDAARAPAPTIQLVPMLVVRPALGDIPDYMPPFTRAAVHADADGNLWIRTTTLVKNQPVYDIVNRRGELVERLQLPAFRTIAGFGPGVVYMAVKDAAGIVHLERARVK